MFDVKTMVLRTAGTNCDYETVNGFELAGSAVERIHINRLIESPALLESFKILALTGGVSFGGAVAAGKILATKIVNNIPGTVK